MESKPLLPLGHWLGSAARWLFRIWNPADLVGPLFFYDLVRLARRRRSFVLRFAYTLTLFAALCLAIADHFATGRLWQDTFLLRTRRELANFSHGFVMAFLFAQSAAVLLITPVYLASAIAEERERQTLTLLFGSHLSDREIVLGKLFARLTHLGNLFLAGVPILLVVGVLGLSDSLVLLLYTLVVIGITLFSVASISMFCSVLCRNVMNALMCSYGCLLALQILSIGTCWGFVSSPIAFLLALDSQLLEMIEFYGAGSTQLNPGMSPWAMTATYALIHVSIAVLCIRWAIKNLRRAEPDRLFRTPKATPRLVPVSMAFDIDEERKGFYVRTARRVSLLPPASGDPLLWKEMAHDPPKIIPPTAKRMKVVATRVALLFAAFGWLVLIDQGWLMLDVRWRLTVAMNVLLRLLSIGTATFWCIALGFRTASSLSRERDHRTLTMLLSLPVDRSTILRARWLGGILRFRTFAFVLAGIWLFGLMTGALHPLAVLLLVGSCGAFVIFLASLGVWLAQVSRDTTRAQLNMAVMLLVLFVGPLLWPINAGDSSQFSDDPRETMIHLWQIGLSPFAVWWVSGFSWLEWREALAKSDALFAAQRMAVVHGIVLLFALAGLLWLAARRRLDMEPRDE
jgi:ABC-type transport system involved in multi-copper enzyme maturation permease subunit